MGDLLSFLFFLIIGLTFGSAIEKSHFKSLKNRERMFINLPTISTQKTVDIDKEIAYSKLVYGCAVISSDFFKDFVASLKNLFGMRLDPYESLMDRARREAILRMKKMAASSDIIINMRIETSEIGGSSNSKSKGVVAEVLAYGTAITYK